MIDGRNTLLPTIRHSDGKGDERDILQMSFDIGDHARQRISRRCLVSNRIAMPPFSETPIATQLPREA
jgi:hypothetical protein